MILHFYRAFAEAMNRFSPSHFNLKGTSGFTQTMNVLSMGQSFYCKRSRGCNEGREYKPETDNMHFGDYAESWMKKNFKNFPQSRVKDYSDIIHYRIIPFFGSKTFDHINGVVLKDFIRTLNWKEGRKERREILISLKGIQYLDSPSGHMERCG